LTNDKITTSKSVLSNSFKTFSLEANKTITTMSKEIIAEKAFAQEIDDFAADLEFMLEKRNNDVSKKFGFDFTNEQPFAPAKDIEGQPA